MLSRSSVPAVCGVGRFAGSTTALPVGVTRIGAVPGVIIRHNGSVRPVLSTTGPAGPPPHRVPARILSRVGVIPGAMRFIPVGRTRTIRGAVSLRVRPVLSRIPPPEVIRVVIGRIAIPVENPALTGGGGAVKSPANHPMKADSLETAIETQGGTPVALSINRP